MRTARPSLAAAVLAACAAAAGAQDAGGDRFDLGLRIDALVAGGEPANDLLGAGVVGRFRIDHRWWIAVSVDHSPGFDVERPYEFVGLAGAEDEAGEVIDAEADMTQLNAAIERRYTRPGRRLEWFWGVGAGFATVDVADVRGPLVGGGEFDLHQEVGTEILVGASAGFRVGFGRGFGLDFNLRAQQHLTDWQVTDRVSGRTAEVDDYLVTGGQIGVSWRF
jgi:hypothetical protein